MTAKEIVKKYSPKSWIEKFKENGVWKKCYYLVFQKNEADTKHRIGEGDTESQAWGYAALWILSNIVRAKYPLAQILEGNFGNSFCVNVNGEIYPATSKRYTAWLKAAEELKL